MMSESIAVSVVIPCNRADELIHLQLEALARQEDAPPFEVMLVDNGGSLRLQEMADRFVERIRSRRRMRAEEKDSLGREIGVVMGWLRYRSGIAVPPPRLGVGI